MAYGLTLVTPPAEEPLDLDATKCWLRLKNDSQDATVTSLIAAARDRCERVTDRQLIAATWDVSYPGFPCGAFPWWGWSPFNTLRTGWGIARGANSPPPDMFPNALRLPKAPLAAVASVKYLDFSGTQQTVDPSIYTVVPSQEPGVLVPSIGNFWPVDVGFVQNAVTVRITAGYGNAAAIPAAIVQALKRCVSHEFEFREAADEDYLDRLFAGFYFGGTA